MDDFESLEEKYIVREYSGQSQKNQRDHLPFSHRRKPVFDLIGDKEKENRCYSESKESSREGAHASCNYPSGNEGSTPKNGSHKEFYINNYFITFAHFSQSLKIIMAVIKSAIG